MLKLSAPLHTLTEALGRLPGVGPKTAQRLAFYLLKQPEAQVQHLAEAILEAYHTVKPCSVCGHLSSHNPCEVCTSTKRNRLQVCVVAEARDLLALERTQQYQGLYHVLGGVLSPMDGVGPDQLRFESLLHRLPLTPPPATQEPTHETTVQPFPAFTPTERMELIIALPPTTEGDTTSLYLSRLLKPFAVTVSRIAFGLPVGGDLDYADQLTITRALQGRNLVT